MRQALILLAVAGMSLAQPAPHPYIGAGGCASSNCHGGTTPLAEADSRILGNEYATWSVADKHSRAFKVMEDARAKRMAEILKIADPTRDRRCTVCHVAGSPEKSRSDGVACEACHGDAEKWLGTHTRPNSHEASVKSGMIDTKNPEVRAKTCLACHLGTGDQVVDHELIAAGHPDLVFELDTFTAAQPAHHRDPPPALRIRAWAVGQTTALAAAMRLLAAHSEKALPEFSDLECYQCHHDLHSDSWRIQRGYGPRRPGSLQINTSHIEVIRELVNVAAAERRQAFEADITRLPQSAGSLERLADALTERFLKQNFDTAAAQAVVRALAANVQRIADAGVNAAEQATMSLDSLNAAMGKKADAVAPLYDYLEHPSVYRAAQFAAMFQKAAAE